MTMLHKALEDAKRNERHNTVAETHYWLNQYKLIAEQALAAPVQEPVALPCCGYTDASAIKWNPLNGVVQCHNCGQTYTPPAAPVQEPVAFNAGVPPLYPEMKDGETISVEYTTPPGGRQSEDCLTAAQKDIQRLSALVRAQQITIDKLEQARSAPVQEPVATIDSLEQEIYENTREFVSLNVMEWLLKRLNTTSPAQRQWVGLTDEEIEAIWYDHHDREMGYAMRFARAIEAKLRSKNNG